MATVSTTSTASEFLTLINELKRKRDARVGQLRGMFAAKVTLTVPTTMIDNADDLVNVIPFPDYPIYLNTFRIYIPTEIDAHVTPTLVSDWKLSGGTTLISGSTSGRANADRDDLDATVKPFIDVSGQSLQFDVTTAAATATAGTIEIYMVLSHDELIDLSVSL